MIWNFEASVSQPLGAVPASLCRSPFSSLLSLPASGCKLRAGAKAQVDLEPRTKILGKKYFSPSHIGEKISPIC